MERFLWVLRHTNLRRVTREAKAIHSAQYININMCLHALSCSNKRRSQVHQEKAK